MSAADPTPVRVGVAGSFGFLGVGGITGDFQFLRWAVIGLLVAIALGFLHLTIQDQIPARREAEQIAVELRRHGQPVLVVDVTHRGSNPGSARPQT